MKKTILATAAGLCLLATGPAAIAQGAQGDHKKQVIATKDAPEAIGPYSQAIKTGKMVFLAGQIPIAGSVFVWEGLRFGVLEADVRWRRTPAGAQHPTLPGSQGAPGAQRGGPVVALEGKQESLSLAVSPGTQVASGDELFAWE